MVLQDGSFCTISMTVVVADMNTRNLQQDPRFTDPEKTWVSNGLIATYWTGSVGIRSHSIFDGMNVKTNSHLLSWKLQNPGIPRRHPALMACSFSQAEMFYRAGGVKCTTKTIRLLFCCGLFFCGLLLMFIIFLFYCYLCIYYFNFF